MRRATIAVACAGVFAVVGAMVFCEKNAHSEPPYVQSQGRSYSTGFLNAEDPLSEGHNWVTGGACGDIELCPGTHSSKVKTVPGLAFGTQLGAPPPPYTDSAALLKGNWGSDQFVEIVVRWNGGVGTDSDYDEVEIRLRGTLAKDWDRTYEITCRVGHSSPNSYIQLIRADGPPDKFTRPIAELRGSAAACQDGDVITGTIVGNVITAYINGRKTIQGVDSTIISGAPGLGFYHQGTLGKNSDFGVSTFVASDIFPRLFDPRKLERSDNSSLRNGPK